MHGKQSKVALVIQNGILLDRSSGAAIQADSVHGLQSKVAIVMPNGILQDRFSGAAIQADPVHGGESKVTRKVTHNHNPWRWGAKPLNTKVALCM